MRHRRLHLALEAFAGAAALQLAADAAGADVPFEIVDAGRRGSPLYVYRPLTEDFIRRRMGVLGRTAEYARAHELLLGLEGGEAYLRLRGESRIPTDRRERADAVLRVFLTRVFEEAGEFELTPERLERAWTELDGVLAAGRTVFTVVAPVLGLEIETAEIPLGEGLGLVSAGVLDDGPGEVAGDAVLAMFTAECDAGSPIPTAAARRRFRRLLSALRLYDAGSATLGPTAWARADGGPWWSVALGGGGHPGRAALRLPAAQEDELRGFCNLIARRAPGDGTLAWALARYEMGCERVAAFEGLTDVLLAARALLEPEGPASGRLAGRLAALCAVPGERAALAERVARAIGLERALIAGLTPAEPAADALVAEVTGHVRAVLRDVICGHLDGDLCGVADELEGAGETPVAGGAPALALTG